jgi:hypothetical protein
MALIVKVELEELLTSLVTYGIKFRKELHIQRMGLPKLSGWQIYNMCINKDGCILILSMTRKLMLKMRPLAAIEPLKCTGNLLKYKE